LSNFKSVGPDAGRAGVVGGPLKTVMPAAQGETRPNEAVWWTIGIALAIATVATAILLSHVNTAPLRSRVLVESAAQKRPEVTSQHPRPASAPAQLDTEGVTLSNHGADSPGPSRTSAVTAEPVAAPSRPQSAGSRASPVQPGPDRASAATTQVNPGSALN
jgi:hypothetical protein